jgi:3-hydroxybutyryl-CoA dehydrogenase
MKYGISPDLEIIRIPNPAIVEDADMYMDLQFDNSPGRKKSWDLTSPPLLIMGAVEFQLEDPAYPFILVNGWPGFIEREILEAAGEEKRKEEAARLAALLNRKLEWVKPVPGLVSPRVISMIINEAYYTLEEGVTDENAIDTAMKLGTNYPFGPFEWAEKIGLDRINTLLNLLAKKEKRYEPAALLTRRAQEL